jgi:hypothetical protein
MDATKNQFQVMKIMGHTTLKTTGRYQHHETAGVGKLLEEARSLRHGTFYGTVDKTSTLALA